MIEAGCRGLQRIPDPTAQGHLGAELPDGAVLWASLGKRLRFGLFSPGFQQTGSVRSQSFPGTLPGEGGFKSPLPDRSLRELVGEVD